MWWNRLESRSISSNFDLLFWGQSSSMSMFCFSVQMSCAEIESLPAPTGFAWFCNFHSESWESWSFNVFHMAHPSIFAHFACALCRGLKSRLMYVAMTVSSVAPPQRWGRKWFGFRPGRAVCCDWMHTGGYVTSKHNSKCHGERNGVSWSILEGLHLPRFMSLVYENEAGRIMKNTEYTKIHV